MYIIFFLFCILFSLLLYGYGYALFLNYKFLLEQTEDGAALANPSWTVRVANERFLGILNIPLAEKEKITLKEIIQNIYSVDIDNLVNDRAVYSPNGRDQVFHQIRISTLKLPLRKQRFYAIQIRDVSETYRLERELQQRNKLEQTAENIAPMKQGTIETQKEVQQLKKEFFHKLGNEIKPAVSGILGIVPLLKQSRGKEEDARYLRALREYGENLRYLSQNMQELADLGDTKAQAERKPLDLFECIEDTMDLFSAQAVEAGLDLNFWIERNVPRFILGDKERLQRILVILLHHAIQHTREGGVFLKISQDQQPKGIPINIKTPLTLSFSLKHSGPAMDKEHISRLFDPLHSLGNTEMHAANNSALGLPLCKQLVKLMGGFIKAEFLTNEGMVFTFTVQTKQAHKRKDKEHNLAALFDKKVLVVDDQLTNRLILQYQLEGWKMRPILVETPAEGWEVLKKDQEVELVISDMQMPLVNGVDFARRAKEITDIPIILLSSIGNLDFLEIEAGLFAKKLTKPSKMEDLLASIFEVFGMENILYANQKGIGTSTFPKLAESYPIKILVAEDNWLNQKLVSHMLDKLGYDVHLVKNGQEVLEACQQMQFDLILMDVRMPIMDGLEATKLLTSQGGKDVPFIVAMTANALKGDRSICLQAGMHDYLTKPFRIEDLQGVIEKFGKKIIQLQ